MTFYAMFGYCIDVATPFIFTTIHIHSNIACIFRKYKPNYSTFSAMAALVTPKQHKGHSKNFPRILKLNVCLFVLYATGSVIKSWWNKNTFRISDMIFPFMTIITFGVIFEAHKALLLCIAKCFSRTTPDRRDNQGRDGLHHGGGLSGQYSCFYRE